MRHFTFRFQGLSKKKKLLMSCTYGLSKESLEELEKEMLISALKALIKDLGVKK